MNEKLRTTGLYYAAFVLLGASVALFGPSLPYLAERTHSRLSEISFLFLASSLGYLAGSFAVGRLYDRLRGHSIMALGLIVSAVALVMVPLVTWLGALTAAVFVLGVAQSTIDIGSNTLLVWIHEEKTGPFMNGLHFFYGTGTFLAPILLTQVLEGTGDIRWAYWALALVILPVTLLLLRQRSPAHPSSNSSLEIRPPILLIIGLMALLFFLMVAGEASYGNWIYTYTLTIGNGVATLAAYINSAYWGGFMIGRLAGVPLSMRFSASTLILFDLIGSIVGLGLILAFPASIPALWIGSVLVGGSLASMFPLGMSLANQWMTITGSVNRWFFVGSSLGGMIFPWAIGQWIEGVGPQVVIVAILGAMLAALIVYFGLGLTIARRKMRVD